MNARFFTKRWVRLAVAVFFVSIHVLALRQMGIGRFGAPFNAAPGDAPRFEHPGERLAGSAPKPWDRLIVSRWDARHYLGIALRGFSQCPRGSLKGRDLADVVYTCDFSFYPGYPVLGWLFSLGGRIPMDYALLAVSLVCAVGFLYLMTSPFVCRALGVGGAYLALFLFNVFPTGFDIATVQTEATTLFFTMAALWALSGRHYLVAALSAGAATGIRISGLATGAAVGLTILSSLWLDRPRTQRGWVSRLAALPLAAWGIFTIVGYFTYKYSDPLLYVHAHDEAYKWLSVPSISERFLPRFVFSTVSHGPMNHYEGVLIAACLVWLALGLRRAVSQFSPVMRVGLYALTFFASAISLFGSWGLSFAGMNRYWLLVIPLFFAMAQVLRRAPVALVLWTVLSSWAYWNIDLCDYVGEGRTHKCEFR